MKKATFLIVLFAVTLAAVFGQTSGEDLAVLNRMMRLKMDGPYAGPLLLNGFYFITGQRQVQ